MKGKFSLTKGKAVFIVDLILLPVFAFVIYSGLKLHAAGHADDRGIWELWAHWHIVAAVLSLAFAGLHIKAHWGWYKSWMKKGLAKKSKATAILSALFLIEVITGTVLVIFIEGGNSAVGMWHYGLGLAMILFLSIHIAGRFRLLMKGLGRKK